jgi:hypothetical protein
MNMSRNVAQGFGLDSPCGKINAMANEREISGLDRQKPLVGQSHENFIKDKTRWHV